MMLPWRRLVEVSKCQIFISRSSDPFLNLSIEHFLLQKSPPHSTVLFLYVNRPCVVIGRNQNPWLEVDLKLLRQASAANVSATDGRGSEPQSPDDVQLVRRRSGGGTVYHDIGNVNYSVICPTAEFTRDKHAEMVTKAIRRFNLRARVNERHDIVLDQGTMVNDQDLPDSEDMHQTAFQTDSESSPPLKASGSAYKMTRLRSLHHGTCLLASGDLPKISRYLSSPARPFMKARGVESVRSPIGNVHGKTHLSHSKYNDDFQREVIQAFSEMYKPGEEVLMSFPGQEEGFRHDEDAQWVSGCVDRELENVEEIRNGIEELKSPKWLYGQTPQFTLSSHPIEEDNRSRPPLPKGFPASARVYLKVKSGAIISSRISIPSNESSAIKHVETFNRILENRAIQDIDDFRNIMHQAGRNTTSEILGVSRWLNTMFGK